MALFFLSHLPLLGRVGSDIQTMLFTKQSLHLFHVSVAALLQFHDFDIHQQAVPEGLQDMVNESPPAIQESQQEQISIKEVQPGTYT